MLIRWFLKRLITLPLRTVSNKIKQIEAEADLSQRIELERTDELGILVGSFNSMLERFSGILRQLLELSQQLANQSQHLNHQAATGLSTTEQLNAETDQVAAAMTEMDQTALTVAENSANTATSTRQLETQTQSGPTNRQHWHPEH